MTTSWWVAIQWWGHRQGEKRGSRTVSWGADRSQSWPHRKLCCRWQLGVLYIHTLNSKSVFECLGWKVFTNPSIGLFWANLKYCCLRMNARICNLGVSEHSCIPHAGRRKSRTQIQAQPLEWDQTGLGVIDCFCFPSHIISLLKTRGRQTWKMIILCLLRLSLSECTPFFFKFFILCV